MSVPWLARAANSLLNHWPGVALIMAPPTNWRRLQLLQKNSLSQEAIPRQLVFQNHSEILHITEKMVEKFEGFLLFIKQTRFHEMVKISRNTELSVESVRLRWWFSWPNPFFPESVRRAFSSSVKFYPPYLALGAHKSYSVGHVLRSPWFRNLLRKSGTLVFMYYGLQPWIPRQRAAMAAPSYPHLIWGYQARIGQDHVSLVVTLVRVSIERFQLQCP